MDKATQKEHRVIAEQCWKIIAQHFPDIIEALDEIEEIKAARDNFVSKLP